MGQTPDREPGESDDEGIVLETWTAGNDPSAAGGIRYVVDAFRLRDALGVYDPRRDSLNEQLLEVAPNRVGMIYTPTYTGGKVTQERWVQTSNSFEIKRITYTYSGDLASTAQIKVFSITDGTTVVAQKTITYSYSGFQVTGFTVTRDV
jgi:hypothetical protein